MSIYSTQSLYQPDRLKIRIFNCWSFRKDENLQVIGIDFICSLVGGDPVLSAEHTKLLWVDKNELNKYNFPKWLIKTIQTKN